MLLRSDYMRDLEVVIIDYTCQVIQTAAVGALNHMVLFGRPVDTNFAALVTSCPVGNRTLR